MCNSTLCPYSRVPSNFKGSKLLQEGIRPYPEVVYIVATSGIMGSENWDFFAICIFKAYKINIYIYIEREREREREREGHAK
jgi:hypothetical protein